MQILLQFLWKFRNLTGANFAVEDKLGGLKPNDGTGSRRPAKRRAPYGFLFLVLVAIATASAVFLPLSPESSIRNIDDFFVRIGGFSSSDKSAIPELGISELPVSIQSSPKIKILLDQLREENCDQGAIFPLADLLKNQGRARQAAEALESFYVRCKGSAELLDNAVELLMTLSDFQKAHELTGTLVRDDPAYARYRYLRGWAAEKLGRLDESLLDHIAALNLLGDPRQVAGSVFYEVARAHARLGQYCEAITPMQQWVSYDLARDTSQTNTIIREFAEKGKCGSSYAIAKKRFTLAVTGDVIIATVEINSIPGRFIIDTGASLVVMKEQFARKANVDWDPKNIIEVLTANGRAKNVLSSARQVVLGSAEANNVSISISPDDGLPGDIDGLLGMSFLARFEVSMTPTQFVIDRAK